MLVLSRKLGESIILPEAGVKIVVVSLNQYAVRIGVSAPDNVHILRDEHIAPDGSLPEWSTRPRCTKGKA